MLVRHILRVWRRKPGDVDAWPLLAISVLMPRFSGDDVRHAVARDMAIAADKLESLMPGLGN